MRKCTSDFDLKGEPQWAAMLHKTMEGKPAGALGEFAKFYVRIARIRIGTDAFLHF